MLDHGVNPGRRPYKDRASDLYGTPPEAVHALLDVGRAKARYVPFRMHRDAWTGPRATNATPFAWFVGNRYHGGPASVHRITWPSRCDNDGTL